MILPSFSRRADSNVPNSQGGCRYVAVPLLSRGVEDYPRLSISSEHLHQLVNTSQFIMYQSFI